MATVRMNMRFVIISAVSSSHSLLLTFLARWNKTTNSSPGAEIRHQHNLFSLVCLFFCFPGKSEWRFQRRPVAVEVRLKSDLQRKDLWLMWVRLQWAEGLLLFFDTICFFSFLLYFHSKAEPFIAIYLYLAPPGYKLEQNFTSLTSSCSAFSFFLT